MGALPTPTARDSKGVDKKQPLLEAKVRDLMPTPTAALGSGGQTSRSGNRKGEPLPGGIAMDLMPTPKASDITKGYANHKDSTGHPSLPVLVGMDQWGKYAEAIHRWESILGRPAPAPTEPGRNGKPRLSAPFVEWMMGIPAGWVTDMGLTRGKTFTILGDGIVPQQAALAIRGLIDELVG